jgi:hypothetical protein
MSRVDQGIGSTCSTTVAAQNGRGSAVAGIAILIIALLSLIPPHGILSDNEENYFALADRFVDASSWPRETAVFDASPHRMLSDATLGALVSSIGYAPAQIVARLLAVAAYAIVLPRLFGVFGLSTLDTALGVMTFALVGQNIVGGEWLFGDYEAKVAAYVLLLAALRLLLIQERLTATTLLFAAATYLHFLVGGFWFLAGMALRLLDAPRDLRRVAEATALFVLLVAPLMGLMAWSRFADTSAAYATDVPPPDVIYSIIREPHHQSPFLSWAYFHDHWLPGYVMATPMLLACLWVARCSETRLLRVMAMWLAGLLAYLFIVLLPKFFDRSDGVLGKFYLFRPSSLILLLFLVLAMAATGGMLRHRAWLLRGTLLAMIGPAFLYIQSGQLVREIVANRAIEGQKRLLAAAVMRVAAPDDIVLIDPAVEMQLLDFERRTGRPTLVMWKFAPTNDADLIAWYRRMEFRRILFDQGCGANTQSSKIAFLLTTQALASRLAESCGPRALRVGHWVILHRELQSEQAK